MTAFHWRNAGKTLTSFLAIIAITAVLAEAIFELMLRFPAYLPQAIMPAMTSYYYSADQRSIQYQPDCAKYDAKLTYILKPGSCNFTGREFDTIVTVNSLGVRDDEGSLQSPEIFVLGDSVAMGWGVADDETFASLVEKETHIKVLNLAVSSYGTVREFDIAERADASRLNTVIVQYSHNDLLENKTYAENRNVLPISDESVYEATKLEQLRGTRYFFGKHVSWLVRRLAGRFFGSAKEKEANDEARYFFNVLLTKFSQLSRRAKLAPASTMVIVQGLPWSMEVSRAALKKVRPRPTAISRLFLIGSPRRRGSFYPLDRHMTAIGHRGVADRIIKIVRDKCYAESEGSSQSTRRYQGCDFFLEEL